MRRRKMHPVGKAVILVACGILVGAAYYGLRYWDYPLAARDLGGAVEAYRKAGLPWHASDIAPKAVKPEENAAVLLRAAFKDWYARSPDMFEVSEDLEAGRLALAAKKLGPVNPNLELMVQASRRPRLDFGYDWNDGSGTYYQDDEALLDCLTLLGERATLRTRQGKLDAAIEDLRAERRLADLIGQEPGTYFLWVRNMVRMTMLEDFDECLYFVANNPDALRRLQSLLEEPTAPDDFGAVLIADGYLRLADLRRYDDIGKTRFTRGFYMRAAVSDDDDTGHPDLPEGMRERAYMTRVLQFWTEAKPVLDRCHNDLREIQTQFDALVDTYRHRKSLSNALNDQLLPYFEPSEFWRTPAKFAVRRALVAALIVRAKTGHFPTRIEDIPTKCIDPFTGQLLKMAQVGSTTRIYSVGWDLKDDGGLTRRENAKSDDVFAIYPLRKIKRYP